MITKEQIRDELIELLYRHDISVEHFLEIAYKRYFRCAKQKDIQAREIIIRKLITID